MHSGEEPPTPFMLACQALEADDRDRLVELLDRFPDLVAQRGTNGNDLLGMAGSRAIVSLLLERGADPNRGNDHGWTKLHQAGYTNDCELARLLLAAGARTDLSARGDGGTPLVAALFWGNREVSELLGREPLNLRVAAGLGDLELIGQLVGTPQAGAHRGFYRPHSGFPVWQPSEDHQEILDEALVWAAKSDRVEAIRLLVDLGARVDADPYRGTALAWAAATGRVRSMRTLIELGADPNQRGTFGGPDHGDGVTAIHLAAQAGHRAAVVALLELGADPLVVDHLHGGNAQGWASHGGHDDLAGLLRVRQELLAREPIFHKPEFGTRMEDYLAMTAEDYWEVGASGRIYDRDQVVDALVARGTVPGDEHWLVSDAQVRRLADDTYAITYRLDQAGRLTRRLTLWREDTDGWKILYHQGTIIQDA